MKITAPSRRGGKASGFSHDSLRTDYRFPSQEAAAELTVFFFGDEIIEAFLPGDATILPECKGIWWQHPAK